MSGSFNPFAYCNSLTRWSRFLTREVIIGDIPLGAGHPVRIQSMTTTDTLDTRATVEQSIRMIEAGCEYVRITAPSLKEAQNLENIKKELRKRGYKTPLIADIHFTPNAAEYAARVVEKVRVNPGNYADKKKFETIEYTDQSYNEELERIRERFMPLVKICREYGTAMRIGTNHGSLSDRILSRYGDTPTGMVESALEFVRICEDLRYRNIVLSMKASNPQVMVQAYRLLIVRMKEGGMNYPLHLGVTEAGEGEDGRIKSAVGIGALLEDGIGDTVRVSLTEDPEFEAPVAINLVKRYGGREKHKEIRNLPDSYREGEARRFFNPLEYTRRKTRQALNVGGGNVPRVIGDLSGAKITGPGAFKGLGYSYSPVLDKWNLGDRACDFVYTGDQAVDFEIPGTLGIIYNSGTWKKNQEQPRTYPLFCGGEFFASEEKSPELNFVAADMNTLTPEFMAKVKGDPSVVLIFETDNEHGMAAQRRMFFELMQYGCDVPVILKRNYSGISGEEFLLYSATDTGALLIDGWGDGIWLKAIHVPVSAELINNASFGILQAARTRISKTEYISCPSCGRTLFDLQETTAKIRNRTDHLKGVKIGIMGCIVNGPGEMADADYGYVGTGIGKITLYRGKEVVKRNVDSGRAVDELIALIREDGKWVER